MHALAQAAAPSLGPMLTWMGVLIAFVVAGGLLLMYIRKRAFDHGLADKGEGMFTSLRRMRDEGKLSAEEYDAAKHSIVGKVSGGHGGPAAGQSRNPAAEPDSRVRDNSSKTPLPSARPRAQAPDAKELRAKPGFDLTGRPLPRPDPRAGDSR